MLIWARQMPCSVCSGGPRRVQRVVEDHEMIRVASKYSEHSESIIFIIKASEADIIKLERFGGGNRGRLPGLSDVIVIVETEAS